MLCQTNAFTFLIETLSPPYGKLSRVVVSKWSPSTKALQLSQAYMEMKVLMTVVLTEETQRHHLSSFVNLRTDKLSNQRQNMWLTYG